MKKLILKLFAISLLLAALVAICLTCATTPERIPDAARPDSPIVTADVSNLYLKPHVDITISRDKKRINSVVVVPAASKEATKITDTDKYSRMIRKVLIEKGIRVVTGEVRAKIEEYRQGALQSRKETLQEAEKLILLGKETGADVILVFDYIGMAEAEKDIYVNLPADPKQITITVKDISSDRPDPDAFRKKLPAILVRGRLVDSESATIVAEFDLVTYFFKNEQELQSQKVTIDKYRYDPVTISDVYYVGGGCSSKKPVSYTYIASYAPIDIRKNTISTILDKYIPRINEIDTVQADKKIAEFLKEVIDEII